MASSDRPFTRIFGTAPAGGVAFGAVPASDSCPARGLDARRCRGGRTNSAVAGERTSPVRMIRTALETCIAPRLSPDVSLAGVPRWVSKLHRPWPGGGLPARANSSFVPRGAGRSTLVGAAWPPGRRRRALHPTAPNCKPAARTRRLSNRAPATQTPSLHSPPNASILAAMSHMPGWGSDRGTQPGAWRSRLAGLARVEADRRERAVRSAACEGTASAPSRSSARGVWCSRSSSTSVLSSRGAGGG